MYFANPWGLLGLLALPTIIAIHLFRRRFPPLQVAGAHLWGAETRVTDAGRRRDRLPITPSLILELLAALLLSLALADPRFHETDSVVQIVAVLDDSASMQAVPPAGVAFRERAAREVLSRVDAAGRDTRVTLLRSGRQPTLLGSRNMSRQEAAVVLAQWHPAATRHDFQPAWDEAVQVVGSDGGFLFVTDEPPAEQIALPRRMEVVALGEPLGNLAFTAARWRLNASGGGEIYLRIANLGRTAQAADVTGTSSGQSVFTQHVEIPPQAEVPLELTVAPGLGLLTVELTSPYDPLRTDNRVQLVEPRVRAVRVAVDLSADSPEEQLVTRALASIPGIVPAAPGDADLLIGHASSLPPDRSDLWWFGIGPLNPAEAFRQQAVDTIGPYLLERQHPLLSGVSLDGVVWGGVQSTDLRLTPLVSVERMILLGRLEGLRTTAWVMNVDLARSNVTDSPDWPILLANLVELRRDALPGLRNWNFQLGEQIQFRAAAAVNAPETELRLLTPDGKSRLLVRGRGDFVEVPPLSETGIYQIQNGGQTVESFAVNFFDRRESMLLDLRRESIAPQQSYEPVKIALDNPFSWLIVAAILLILLAILLDWRVLSRGSRTVAGTARAS